MWRRWGLSGLNHLSLFLGLLVVGSLAALVFVLLVPAWQEQPEVVYQVLLALILLTVLSLVGAVAYQSGYFSYSESHFERTNKERERWMGVWHEVLFNRAPLPTRTADPIAAEALLIIKDTLEPEKSEKARHIYEMTGLLARDMHILRTSSSRLEKVRVLERWALLCDPQTHPMLYQQCFSKHPDLQRLALTSLARSMAVSQVPRKEVARTFERLVRDDRFSSGWIEQVLVLLGDRGVLLLQDFLKDEDQSMQLRALRALTYVRAEECLDECLTLLNSKNPDLRAASLKVLVSMQQVPSEAVPEVYALLEDPVWFVRAQAALACKAIKSEQVTTLLYDALADEAWWVRHNSAQALLELGPEGHQTLQLAMHQHPDRYARDMASQSLQAA